MIKLTSLQQSDKEHQTSNLYCCTQPVFGVQGLHQPVEEVLGVEEVEDAGGEEDDMMDDLGYDGQEGGGHWATAAATNRPLETRRRFLEIYSDKESLFSR